jgi:hypothetical protein
LLSLLIHGMSAAYSGRPGVRQDSAARANERFMNMLRRHPFKSINRR